MADSRQLTAVQINNCGGPDHEAFLRVVPPPRKTGFNPFGSGKSKKWADDEVERVVRCLGAKVKKIFFQKKSIHDGKVFVCTGVLIWFEKGMHPKAKKKMLKGKPVKITWKIHVREDHDVEKYGEAIEEWEWRFVPAKNAPLTKKQKEEQHREKMVVLELSSDSESEDEGF
jgi:hypothetical protein